jgi:hypothetical protein
LSSLRSGLLDESQNRHLYELRDEMKKSLHLVLDDEDVLELIRILTDEDADSSLTFLKEHFKGKARELLENG